MIRSYLNLIVLIFLIGCADRKDCRDAPDVTSIDISLDIARLEQELFKLTSHEEILDFFSKYPVFTYYFIDSFEYPSKEILARRTLSMIREPHITDTLYRETMQTFGELNEVEREFTAAFKLIRYYYPEFKVPRIQTAITGFYKDLFLSDSLIIIGLDFYLGEGATYRPVQDIPQYILDRYQPENVVPMVVYFLSDHFNRVDLSNATLLNEMINFGKAYYFTSQMVPCASEAQIIGYSNEVLSDVKANQEVIWASFIQNELIYETNHEIKNKFIGERPKIPEIGDKCPGRIAAWLGYQIVKSYMLNNPEVSLQELMRNTRATEIFMQSEYKPRNQ